MDLLENFGENKTFAIDIRIHCIIIIFWVPRKIFHELVWHNALSWGGGGAFPI